MKYRLVSLVTLGHLVTDINQGAVPALLPFLIAAHDLSYTAAAGIVLATNITSTIVQPLFGHWADKISRPWLMPLGVFLAGLGMAVIGVVPGYRLILAAAMVSGIGVAAYHPEGARMVAATSPGRRGTAMAIFGVGGTMGFALGPPIATGAMLYLGLRGSLVLLAPVLVTALILLWRVAEFSQANLDAQQEAAAAGAPAGRDQWGPFGILTLVVIGRSILFYGLNTFIPLYWISVLGQSKAAGGTALTIFAFSTVAGNLLGGRLGDKYGLRKILVRGMWCVVPILPLLLWVKQPVWGWLLLVPVGLAMSTTYSPLILLGHQYLPGRVGFSSGITIGVAVAVGGLAMPVLGQVADHFGVWYALAALACLPLFFAAVSLALPDPQLRPASGQGGSAAG